MDFLKDKPAKILMCTNKCDKHKTVINSIFVYTERCVFPYSAKKPYKVTKSNEIV